MENLCLRPSFLSLPEPVKSKLNETNSVSILYESYNELKFKATTEKYRPSWDPLVNKNSLKAQKYDMEVSRSTKTRNNLLNGKSSLCHGNNIRSIVKCQNCSKKRLVFA